MKNIIITITSAMFFFGSLTLGCKKKINNPVTTIVQDTPLSYALNMGGVRTWTGTDFTYTNYGYLNEDSFGNNISKSFAINIINDTTISFNDYLDSSYVDTISFISMDKIAKTMRFQNVLNYPYFPISPPYDYQVIYEYQNNSIEYSEVYYYGMGGARKITLHTP
jgi:hypothetical protein